ncbi:hypothetical protein B188_17050 [Candidatus Brocadiaceae bacterium B188]|nr:hypothetical protein B188_17050 [Candidatus Brocadiaceae bacterium B188]
MVRVIGWLLFRHTEFLAKTNLHPFSNNLFFLMLTVHIVINQIRMHHFHGSREAKNVGIRVNPEMTGRC